MLAAMHPSGQFHAIDAMLGHIEHGQRFATEVGATISTFMPRISPPRLFCRFRNLTTSWLMASIHGSDRKYVIAEWEKSGRTGRGRKIVAVLPEEDRRRERPR
jgi:hypothetical protein